MLHLVMKAYPQYDSPEAVEMKNTPDQIRLKFFFMQRDQARNLMLNKKMTTEAVMEGNALLLRRG